MAFFTPQSTPAPSPRGQTPPSFDIATSERFSPARNRRGGMTEHHQSKSQGNCTAGTVPEDTRRALICAPLQAHTREILALHFSRSGTQETVGRPLLGGAPPYGLSWPPL